MQGVKNVCKGLITELDASQSEQLVLEEIARVLKLKATKAPSRPKRIILLGPPGSEKQQHALRIAQKYQLIYINVTQLLKDYIRRGDNSTFYKDMAFKLKNDQPGKYLSVKNLTHLFLFETVEDEHIIDIVRMRLENTDCKINGWILDGCPLNLNQIKLLKEEV